LIDSNHHMWFCTSKATRVAALESGIADLIEANILMLDGIESAGAEVAWQDEISYNWVVMVDCWDSDMWCFDKRVRQAMEMAIPRKEILEQLYGRGATQKGWAHVTPSSLGYSPELDPLPFDLRQAKALLAEAGIVDGKWNGEQVSFDVYTWDAGDVPLLPELSQLFLDAWRFNLGFDVGIVVGDASRVRSQWNNRELAGNVIVRTNEARFDGTSLLSGGWANPDIPWRAINNPNSEPFASTSVSAVKRALEDINPHTRADSFNEAYRVLKDEHIWWSAFHSNVPWGFGPRVKTGSYRPWTLVPYLTAIWTIELAERNIQLRR